MFISTKRTFLIAAFAFAGQAAAQSNLGEVLDMGGTKLTAEEVKNLVVGSTLTGASRTPDREMSITYKQDHSLTGRVTWRDGSVGIFGPWKLEDDGKMCTELSFSSAIPKNTTCSYFFKVSNQYFVSDSDSDRAAKVLKRSISR